LDNILKKIYTQDTLKCYVLGDLIFLSRRSLGVKSNRPKIAFSSILGIYVKSMKRVVIIFLSVFILSELFAADTELQLYRPFTETTKQLPLKIVEKKTGECVQQSKLIVREDAWRCVTEGSVYDPCFVKPYSSQKIVVCPGTPWTKLGIEIQVSKPLDNAQHLTLDMSQTFPWGVELVDGKNCQAVEELVQYDNLAVHYRCDDSTVLIGHVQRCQNVWKMLQHDSHGITTVEIAKAWF
jgi:hypothetical protein